MARRPGSDTTHGRAIAPVVASRAVVFAPTIRKPKTDVLIEGSFGRARIRGNIGMMHKKLLDTAIAVAEEEFILQTGQAALLVDPYQLCKLVGTTNRPDWLKEMFHDLRVATVEGIGADGLPFEGGIVSEWKVAKQTRAMPGGKLKHAKRTERTVMVLIVSNAWMRIKGMSLAIRYKPILPIVNSIKCSAAYTLAQLVITHREFNRPLVDVLDEIGALRPDMTRQGRQKVIETVRGLSDVLARVGITITASDIVHYRQHEGVRFMSAQPNSTASQPNSTASQPNSTVPQETLQESQEGEAASLPDLASGRESRKGGGGQSTLPPAPRGEEAA
jgi:hypothetical protein